MLHFFGTAEELQAVREVLAHLRFSENVDRLVAAEGPDVEVWLRDARLVGVEVTELSDAALASGRANVQRLKHALAAQPRRESIDASVHMSNGEGFASLLSGREVQERHVDALVALVRKHANAGSTERTFRHAELAAHGINYVLELRISEGSQVIVGLQSNGRGHAFVQQCIDAKNAMAAAYRVSGSELWLVMLAGTGMRNAVWSAVVEDDEYISAFDRTFVVDAYENRVLEVKTRRS